MGGLVDKVEIPIITLQANSDLKVETWQTAINEAREYAKATGIYTDGSKLDDRSVGAGWHVEGKMEERGSTGLGKIAAVWDSEIAGIKGALRIQPKHHILILSDSEAAIATVKKAGKTRKARTRDLRLVMREIKARLQEW